MKLGFIGLGKMGGNMVERLLKNGYDVAVFDTNSEVVAHYVGLGALGSASIEELASKLEGPKALWVMVPAGEITEKVITQCLGLLSKGDILIDGGNSLYKESVKRSEAAAQRGISYLDVGTSGGIWGLTEGYCMMVGGEKEAFEKLEPYLKTLAPEGGLLHAGPSGAGHYVKMVHNGIEYGMMQAYAEGFELMKSKTEYDLDLGKISALWNHGSVVRSWLLELLEHALGEDVELSELSDYVSDSGEGRWTVQESVEQAVPLPVITAALFKRFESRQDESYAGKVLAALRKEFGGHAVKASGGK